jgi:ABC-type glycerol-3-phosphate transport system substrate-binding protein
MGGYIFGQNDKGGYNASDVGLNKPGAVEAVTYLKKFYADDVFPAGIVGDNGLNAIDSLFTEKKAAAVINGPWAFQPYEAAGINYGGAAANAAGRQADELLPRGERLCRLDLEQRQSAGAEIHRIYQSASVRENALHRDA